MSKSKDAIVVSVVHMHFFSKLTPTLVSFYPLFPFARFRHSVTKTVSTPTVQRVSPSSFSPVLSLFMHRALPRQGIYDVVGWILVVCSIDNAWILTSPPCFPNSPSYDWRRKHRTKSMSSFPLFPCRESRGYTRAALRHSFCSPTPSRQSRPRLESTTSKAFTNCCCFGVFCPSSHALCCYAQCSMDVCVYVCGKDRLVGWYPPRLDPNFNKECHGQRTKWKHKAQKEKKNEIPIAHPWTSQQGPYKSPRTSLSLPFFPTPSCEVPVLSLEDCLCMLLVSQEFYSPFGCAYVVSERILYNGKLSLAMLFVECGCCGGGDP